MPVVRVWGRTPPMRLLERSSSCRVGAKAPHMSEGRVPRRLFEARCICTHDYTGGRWCVCLRLGISVCVCLRWVIGVCVCGWWLVVGCCVCLWLIFVFICVVPYVGAISRDHVA